MARGLWASHFTFAIGFDFFAKHLFRAILLAAECLPEPYPGIRLSNTRQGRPAHGWHPYDNWESELLALYPETGVDFSELPPIMTAPKVASLLDMTVDALSQDRVGGNPTIPYVKLGRRRIRYLRSDLIRFLLANRIGDTEAWR